MANFPITPFAGLLENTEFNFGNLFFHHLPRGAKRNQVEQLGGDKELGFGHLAVNNWTVYDGSGPDAKEVGHVRGVHVYAKEWHNSSTLDFEAGRFKGSTLQIMGPRVEGAATEWAIVGGTGDLAMARGVVKRKQLKQVTDGSIQELTIHGFCRMQSLPALTKYGPWGGEGGSETDSVEPWRIESMEIIHDGVIGSFEYTYVGISGKRHTAGPWGWGGGNGANHAKVELGPNEIVKAVSGTYVNHNNGNSTIQSLTFVTNVKTYGPYGPTGGTPFDAKMPTDKSVVGFFGRTDGRYLNAFGVYTV